MKILHCCLAAFYIDNYSYQENIFPKMHRLQGHQVEILASTETYIGNAVIGYVEPRSYQTKEGIPVTRVPYVKWLPHFVMKKLRIYKGIPEVVERFKPDIIFLHDCSFVSITAIIAYVKRNRDVRIYVDGHTDFMNSAKNWVSKNILHKIVYRWCAQRINPYARKFYGTLPLRVDFFRNVYGIPAGKTELLVLGADDSLYDLSKKELIKKSLRSTLNIKESDFVMVTGGKIDERKNIHLLMRAVSELEQEDIIMVVFGTPNEQMKPEIEKYTHSSNIRFVGWIPSEQAYNYFLAADLAFFPGTHSVLWEQAVGVGLPCIFKSWPGIQHVDLGGNCLFIDSADLKVMKDKILTLYRDRILLAQMEKVAIEKGIPEFSYSKIAKRAIEEPEN